MRYDHLQKVECVSRVTIGDCTRLSYASTVQPDPARLESPKLDAGLATPVFPELLESCHHAGSGYHL